MLSLSCLMPGRLDLERAPPAARGELASTHLKYLLFDYLISFQISSRGFLIAYSTWRSPPDCRRNEELTRSVRLSTPLSGCSCRAWNQTSSWTGRQRTPPCPWGSVVPEGNEVSGALRTDVLSLAQFSPCQASGCLGTWLKDSCQQFQKLQAVNTSICNSCSSDWESSTSPRSSKIQMNKRGSP